MATATSRRLQSPHLHDNSTSTINFCRGTHYGSPLLLLIAAAQPSICSTRFPPHFSSRPRLSNSGVPANESKKFRRQQQLYLVGCVAQANKKCAARKSRVLISRVAPAIMGLIHTGSSCYYGKKFGGRFLICGSMGLPYIGGFFWARREGQIVRSACVNCSTPPLSFSPQQRPPHTKGANGPPNLTLIGIVCLHRMCGSFLTSFGQAFFTTCRGCHVHMA